MTKKILFTGGGSAGHVTVNIALIPEFINENWTVKYMGSKNGIEAKLIKQLDGVEYISISSGKLRRYMDLENFKDPFRIVKGVFQAYQIIRKQKPDVIFSKGGFVSVPVVLGAWLNKVPVVIHESDISPGLANKIALPLAKKVCLTFEETKKHIKSDKAIPVGPIIRKELKHGDADKGYELCGLSKGKPVILIMGGSLGSRKINEVIRSNLQTLLTQYQVVHLCGQGQVDSTITTPGYKQFEYIQDELANVLAMADLVISRAGSNSIFEFLALRKPMLLIPLSLAASRGDQILNAQSFKASGYCEVLQEEELNNQTLIAALTTLSTNKKKFVAKMTQDDQGNAVQTVMQIIISAAK